MATSPFLVERATVPGLAHVGLDQVPEDTEAWLGWRDRVRAYRELRRRQAANDREIQRIEWNLCERDPAYWMIMYGVIFEPREIADLPPMWYPWVLFPFQIKTIRWIQHVMKQSRNGRGDGVAEKSRDMGLSWLFCGYMAHQWLFAPAFIGGVVSRNANAVDQTNDSDSLFFKIRSNLALQPQVPDELKLPEWMRPKGMAPEMSTKAHIAHPTKTNIIQGESTTEMSGVGGRATMRLVDEAARFAQFGETWANQAAVTTHRFAISSADTIAPRFRELTDLGREGLEDEDMYAPSYLRLDWWVHPFHDREWFENERARFTDQAEFEREYEISYSAGSGDAVYPRFSSVELGEFPYSPTLGTLYCAIDPGVRDPTAVIWIQEDPITKRFRVVDSFEGRGGEDARFIASVMVGVPISGVGGYDYGSYPGLYDLMDWTASLNRPVVYFGDPAGTHRGGDGKTTFYEALRNESAALTAKRNIIHVRTVTANNARSHMKRKNALSALAYRLDFNNSAGANAVLTSLKESRYPERKEGRGYVTEVLEPLHDVFSHRRTAMEFWAVNMEVEERVQKSSVARPARFSMSGKRR